MTERRFAGKNIMITGGGSGIGRVCALRFAQEGANVALWDRHRDQLDEALDLIASDGGSAFAIMTDVSDEQSVSNAFAETLANLGTVDFAVNNAGINQEAALTADIPGELWRAIMDTNVTGVWLCMREELSYMAQRRQGAIINIASLAGLKSLPMQSAYVASKHALVGLTRNAAIEYAPMGIRVASVAPGAIATAMMFDSLAGLDPEEQKNRLAEIAVLHPMNRYGEPSEVADAVLFLCSDQASFITGACLPVDGGWASL